MSGDQAIVVTGFRRCGTTLLMRMLYAGGVDVVADTLFGFEDKRANGLPRKWEWFEECRGKAVKVIDPHRFTPPLDRIPSLVVFLTRNPREQAKSICKFAYRVNGDKRARGLAGAIEIDIRRELKPTLQLLARRLKNGSLVTLPFEETIASPRTVATELAQFLGRQLDVDAMVDQVVPRGPECYRGLLELALTEAQRRQVVTA